MDQSNTEEMALNKKMPRNLINTAKYNVLNFIPLNLFNQFKKIQNLYFTVITFMQMQQSITITSGLPTVGYNLVPLIILSMIKDAFEDYKRHKADKSENEKKALVYNLAKCTFEQRAWKTIYPGEILKIEDDDFLPCDILLLSTSDPNGLCYVETKSLDGETNLKIK